MRGDTGKHRALRKFEAFDGVTLRSASDLEAYLRKNGFGRIRMDRELERNEVAYFSDETTLVFNGKTGEIVLEYCEPTTAGEIIESLEGQLYDGMDDDDIVSLCSDEASILSSEYTSCEIFAFPLNVRDLETAASEIDRRVARMNDEAINGACRHLMAER